MQRLGVTAEALFERVLGVNTRGPFFLIQEAARRMADGGWITGLNLRAAGGVV